MANATPGVGFVTNSAPATGKPKNAIFYGRNEWVGTGRNKSNGVVCMFREGLRQANKDRIFGEVGGQGFLVF
ncbi:MAG: hypothetical protein D6714_14790 [Bacteroidetes bacterium]|nr:MAG: hypothetical protein D6714_14790 [Bacteroidota bacterium]